MSKVRYENLPTTTLINYILGHAADFRKNGIKTNEAADTFTELILAFWERERSSPDVIHKEDVRADAVAWALSSVSTDPTLDNITKRLDGIEPLYIEEPSPPSKSPFEQPVPDKLVH